MPLPNSGGEAPYIKFRVRVRVWSSSLARTGSDTPTANYPPRLRHPPDRDAQSRSSGFFDDAIHLPNVLFDLPAESALHPSRLVLPLLQRVLAQHRAEALTGLGVAELRAQLKIRVHCVLSISPPIVPHRVRRHSKAAMNANAPHGGGANAEMKRTSRRARTTHPPPYTTDRIDNLRECTKGAPYEGRPANNVSRYSVLNEAASSLPDWLESLYPCGSQRGGAPGCGHRATLRANASALTLRTSRTQSTPRGLS